MNESLKFIGTMILAGMLCVFCFDYAQVKNTKIMIKNSLDLSTKAAALQIDKDRNKLGKGIFEIDQVEAKKVNENIFKDNISNRINDYEIKTDIVNAHSNTIYTAINGNSYNIDEPTVFSSIKYEYKGIFLHRTLETTVSSGSSLRNVNEIK